VLISGRDPSAIRRQRQRRPLGECELDVIGRFVVAESFLVKHRRNIYLTSTGLLISDEANVKSLNDTVAVVWL